jgi:hypothetical protein
MRRRIGEFLVAKGILTSEQVDRVLVHSRRTSLRFGEAGQALGVLTVEMMKRLLGVHHEVDFFNLDPSLFPRETQELLPLEAILRLGALPLGVADQQKIFRSKKALRLGLLDPSRAEAVREAARLASERPGAKEFEEVRVFLVVADQFADILREVYGLQESALKALGPEELDPTLVEFFKQPS